MSVGSLSGLGTTLAVAGGSCVILAAATARMVPPPLAQAGAPQTAGGGAPGGMTLIGLGIALIGFATAGLPHAYKTIELLYADRRHRREMAALDRINDLAAANCRLAEVERIVANYRELERTAVLMESRTICLEETVGLLIPPVKANQEDLGRVAGHWNDPESPDLRAALDPPPVPTAPAPDPPHPTRPDPTRPDPTIA